VGSLVSPNSKRVAMGFAAHPARRMRALKHAVNHGDAVGQDLASWNQRTRSSSGPAKDRSDMTEQF
jgi:hypothetical protein